MHDIVVRNHNNNNNYQNDVATPNKKRLHYKTKKKKVNTRYTFHNKGVRISVIPFFVLYIALRILKVSLYLYLGSPQTESVCHEY